MRGPRASSIPVERTPRVFVQFAVHRVAGFATPPLHHARVAQRNADVPEPRDRRRRTVADRDVRRPGHDGGLNERKV